MVKRVSLFVMIFTVCIFAENTHVVQHEATHTTAPTPAPAHAEPPAVEAQAAPVAETGTVQPEQTATEAAAVAEPATVAPVAPVVAPAPPAPVATESAKEAIIDNPIEFAIVSAVFIATVLLITLTGN